MAKYLYGAAVQGIQQFIFRTNELRNIVGASELVEQICTSAFDEFAKVGESIVRAAGNIKYIFNEREDCEFAVRNFPKKVMTMAPGITISQAVVPFEDDDFEKAIDDIEGLLKQQRNKPSKSVTYGLMGMKRANNTGLPVIEVVPEKYDEYGKIKREKQFLDEASVKISEFINTKKLCEKSFGIERLSHKEVAYDISDITDKNDWIAVIHADGNGLGKVVQKVGKNKEDFKEFSERLDKATEEAANEAYKAVKDKFDRVVIPIRPVVLSGDDMTVIIRGDLAIDYSQAFINAFEYKTRLLVDDILKKHHVFAEDADYLTACAGVAFIKSSYPFYFGYQLAEELCKQAKKDTKAIYGEESNYLPPSCLMFHKVQDSFIYDYKDDIVERELTAYDGLSFMAGPYYIKKSSHKFTVSRLQELTENLDTDNGEGLRSGIRDWIELRLDDKNKADQRKSRMLQIFSDDKVQTTLKSLTDDTDNRCIAYDVLSYYTIKNQKTKEDE